MHATYDVRYLKFQIANIEHHKLCIHITLARTTALTSIFFSEAKRNHVNLGTFENDYDYGYCNMFLGIKKICICRTTGYLRKAKRRVTGQAPC